MSLLPPNPSLVAIIVLIKTKQGVKHVYHYPPNPGHDTSTISSRHDEDHNNHSSDSDAAVNGYSSSDESARSSLEDDHNSDPDIDAARGSRRSNGEIDDASINESGSTSPEKNGLPKWRAKKGHKEFLSLPADFQTFLCPSNELGQHRFEIVIDQLTFVGWPCSVKEDGTWKTRRKKRESESRGKDAVRSGSAQGGGERLMVTKRSEEDVRNATDADVSTHDETNGSEPDEPSGVDSENEATNEAASDNASVSYKRASSQASRINRSDYGTEQTLSMFHIVFVMNPPLLEYHARVDDMYTYVAKPFSKALKREQARSDYVWKECEKLKAMKAKHDPDSRMVFRNSRLAKAIATLFNAISSSRTAHVALTPSRACWLQIPTPMSISSLPSRSDPQLPGVWLTTSTAMPVDDELTNSGNRLASHFALLLLTDVQSILAGISNKSPLRVALEQYLSHSTPTKSLLQISVEAHMQLGDVIQMTSHLIHYRQARIIPPLNKKNVYIVSPNADMRRLKAAAVEFQKEFPLQAHLTTILSRLYAANRPYKTIIPKDYKEAYMNMLAWLMRGGWVTQLQTFGWVRVSSEVRKIVHDMEEIEKHNGEQKKKRRNNRAARNNDASSSATNEDESEENDTDDQASEEKHLLTMISSGHSASARSNVSTPSTVRSRTSTSSALTAVPIHHGRFTEKLSLPPLLISSPTKTSGMEKKYLEFIASEIERNNGVEAKDAWLRCLPFFDGDHALEQLPVRHDWKRSWIETLRAGWVKGGWLTEVKSW